MNTQKIITHKGKVVDVKIDGKGRYIIDSVPMKTLPRGWREA